MSAIRTHTSHVGSIEDSPGLITSILVPADMMTQETLDAIIAKIAREGSVSREELPHEADESVIRDLCEMGWLAEDEPGLWKKGWKAEMFTGTSGDFENYTAVDTEETE